MHIKKLAVQVIAVIIIVAMFGLSNAHAEIGVTDTEILIGSSLALEGHAAYLGTETLHGFMAYINEINEQGGVNGRKIRMLAYNDSYNPDQCVTNTNKLIKEDKVFALSCYVGTPTSVKAMPVVEEAAVPLIGLFTGAESLRNPVKRHIFNIRGSYYEETAGIVSHFWEELGLRKIAVFYQNDDFGKTGLKGVEIALAKYNSKPVAQASYERGSEDVTPAFNAIRQAAPEAVVIIGVYGPAARFIMGAKWSGFDPYFHCISFVGANKLAYLLGTGSDGDGVIVTQVVPTPDDSLPGIAEYRNYLEKYIKKNHLDLVPNFVSLEGFINAKTLVLILNKLGKDVTRDGFIKTAESLKDIDLGIGAGATLSYGPEDHQGLDKVYFTILKSGKYEVITDWKKVKTK
ncbi:MAG: ABC transporter substrate-binding protein [Desulfamplus sp.]|nr:ABC transporter substrate-binding protein [Desulfamplus sp.]